MAHAGQTLENRARGERITFRRTAAETNGALVAIDLELPPGARVPGGPHIHPLQEERFEIVRGTMRFRLRQKKIIAGPGTLVVVPPGVPHDFANAGDEDALVRVEVRPALKMEQVFETAISLAGEGRTMLRGIPKPLDLAPVRSPVRAGGAGHVPTALGAASCSRTAGLAGHAPRLCRPLRRSVGGRR